jgi:hypothetical protein
MFIFFYGFIQKTLSNLADFPAIRMPYPLLSQKIIDLYRFKPTTKLHRDIKEGFPASCLERRSVRGKNYVTLR